MELSSFSISLPLLHFIAVVCIMRQINLQASVLGLLGLLGKTGITLYSVDLPHGRIQKVKGLCLSPLHKQRSFIMPCTSSTAKRFYSYRMNRPYHMIDSGTQLTYSPTAGDFRIAIPAFILSTIAAGALSYVISKHLPNTITDKISLPPASLIPLPGLSSHLSTNQTSAR